MNQDNYMISAHRKKDIVVMIMGTSAYAYDALCIVPYALIVLGCLIILFSAFKKGLIALACSVIASGGMAWAMRSTELLPRPRRLCCRPWRKKP